MFNMRTNLAFLASFCLAGHPAADVALHGYAVGQPDVGGYLNELVEASYAGAVEVGEKSCDYCASFRNVRFRNDNVCYHHSNIYLLPFSVFPGLSRMWFTLHTWEIDTKGTSPGYSGPKGDV